MANLYLRTIRISISDPTLAAVQIRLLLRTARGDSRDCCPHAAQVFQYIAGRTSTGKLAKAKAIGWKVRQSDTVQDRIAHLNLAISEGSPICIAILGVNRPKRYDQLKVYWIDGVLTAEIDFEVWRPIYTQRPQKNQPESLIHCVPSATSVEITLPGGETLRNDPLHLITTINQRCGRQLPRANNISA